MKIIKVIYSNNTDFILDIVNSIEQKVYKEFYNIDINKEKKKAIPIMVRHGTKNTPLIVFENENLEEYSAIWSESNPKDWKIEITNKLINGLQL